MADPWENDAVVPVPRPRQQAAPAYGVVASSYTNENPDELRAQGYELDPATGTWTKVVGTAPAPGGSSPSDPWTSDPVLTDSQTRAAEQAVTTNGAYDAGSSVYQGLLAGFADELAGKSAGLGQLGRNAIRRVQGQPIQINSADLSNAVTNEWRQQERQFAQDHPVQNIGGQIAGGLLTGGVGGTRAAGLAAARGAALQAGETALARQLGRQAVRQAANTTGVYGALAGAGNAEGGVIERAPEAAIGGVVGYTLGGAVQSGGQAAAPYISRIAGITGAGSNPIRNAAARRGADPEARAAMRFVDTLDPQAAFAERARLQSLGIQPSLADVGGNTSERLIRTAAGPAGPAADIAVTNAVSRQANLKPEIMAVTRGLSPEQGTASQYVDALTSRRSNLASAEYAPAYQARVPVSEEVITALADEPGRAALRRARLAAVARQDAQQVQEIDGLLSGSPPGEISAGTLDRVRIAMQGRGAAMQQRPDTRDIAGGLFSRASQLDTALEAVPELAPARANYRNLSGAIDAVDEASQVFSTAPEDFAAIVSRMTPEQRDAMIVGVRQEIMDTLGGQRNAGTGSLQTISESPYARQNLEALLGPDEASRYIEGIRARVQQSQRAQRISPNTNSQTFGRSMDEDTFSAANMIGAGVDAIQGARGNVVAIGRTIDRIRARATMSPEERQAIAQLGLGSADELERIVQLADQARATGRRTPREVRAYILRTRNVLGAQTPEQLQIERLLLPAPASAEEEQQ